MNRTNGSLRLLPQGRLVRQTKSTRVEWGNTWHSRRVASARDDNSAWMDRRPIVGAVVFFIAAFALAFQFAAWAQDASAADQGTTEEGPGLTIEPTELPVTYPHGPYDVVFHGRGNYVPTLHWSVESGKLPPGITLDENGALRGAAERGGEFQFVIAVHDSGKPEQAVHKSFTLKVVEALTVAWKVPAHVDANRIEGSVEVSNTTAEDMDFTFDVKAVAENGRATEIGYQHFPLKRGTTGMALPFGDTLPSGAYMVYVDVNGEVARWNAIYKQEMHTPRRLHVTVGP